MKVACLLTLCFVIVSCQSQNEKTNDETDSVEVLSDNTSEPTNKTTPDEKPEITFDPRLTEEEWINTIWIDQFGEHPEEIMGMIDLDPQQDYYNLFFVIKNIEGTQYYTLIMNEDETYDLTEVPVADNSWVKSYGQSSYSTASIYDLAISDVNDDRIKDIVVSVEIHGTTQGEEGMMRFQKVQHDIITVNNGEIAQNSKLTADYNEKHGVKVNEDVSLDKLEFLNQKYYSTITNNYEHHKMELLLADLDVLTNDINNSENKFQRVEKQDNGKYVVNTANAYSAIYFVPYENNFETHELDHFDYPIFYVEDHGIYVYSITNIKVDDELIKIALERIYHKDENSGEYNDESLGVTDITLQYNEEKWVMHDYEQYYDFMTEKDAKKLKEINSNEGE